MYTACSEYRKVWQDCDFSPNEKITDGDIEQHLHALARPHPCIHVQYIEI